MLRIHRLALISLSASLALAVAGCGISSSVDDVFSNSGGAGATGTTDGGGGSGATGDTGAGGPGGSSTGGDTSGGAAGSPTTGGGGGTTMPGTEDCLDGVDNDGDGDIDCADSDCTPDFECVPNVPNGWTGHFQVTRTDYPTPPAPCAGGVDPSVYYAGPAGPAECSSCSCGAPAGASCSAPKLTCWAGSTSCGGNATDWTNALADGQCHKPNLLGANFQLSCAVTEPSQVINSGQCEPSPVDFANKDPWQNEVGACEVSKGGGCGNGQACVPKLPGGMQAKLCVQKDGDVACPAGAFAQKAQAFTGGTDERSCTDCTCGDGGTTCSGGSYTVYDQNQCQPPGNGNDPNVVVDSASCKNVSALLDFGSWSMQASLPTPQGNCPPAGGAPQGEVKTTGPVTFCCVP